MNNNLQQKRGFILIEILISLVLFGLIMVSIYTVMTQHRFYIYSAGQRDRIITEAANSMRAIYADQPYETENQIENRLANNSERNIDNPGDLYDTATTDDETLHYQIKDVGDGFAITLVLFYGDGSRYVELSSFIRKGAD
ncbi:MAG: PulJ/GspJ family protein [Halanaerobiaceae bacterium]